MAGDVRVREVLTAADMRRFVRLPRELYRGDPCWAPPLWIEERGAYTARNAILSHSDYALLLAERDGRIRAGPVVGRSLVYVDHAFNRYYGSRIGFFGAFECANDFDAARALDEEAVRWLARRGMAAIRGPIHPVAESWGFLIEGFGSPPVFMAPYNPRFYNEFMARLGYGKAKDLLAYEGSAKDGYRIPARFERFSERLLARRPGLSIRRLAFRNLERDAEAILRISNEAVAGNWGYVPLDRGELLDMLRRLKPIADPDAVWFVEDQGEAVGFALGFPDLNVILRKIGGRLLPFGFLRIALGARRVRDHRLFALAVLPRYHGQGLDVLLYLALYRALSGKIDRLEANYILEDNWRIRRALEKLGLDLVKAYRVYEKQIG